MHKKTLIISTALFFASLALSNPSRASDSNGKKLNLKDILSLTQANDQRIEAARYSYKIAREDISEAKSYYRPKLNAVGNLSYSETPVTNFFGTTTRDGLNIYGGVEVNQELFSFGRYSAMMGQSKASAKQALHELSVTESDVMLEAIRAYLNYSRALKVRDAYTSYANHMAELLKRTQDKFDNQLIGRSELLLVRSRLQQAQAAISNNDNELTRAHERLAKLINLSRYDIVDQPVNFYELHLPKSLNDAIQLAQTEDPRVKASQAHLEGKDKAAALAKAELHPRFSLVAGYTKGKIDGTPTGETKVGMNMQLPLYNGGSTRSKLRRAKSDASRARSLLTDEIANSGERVTSAWKIFKSLERNEKSWQAAYIAEKEAVDEIQKEVDSEIRSLIVLLEAREQLMEAEVNATLSKFNRILAGYELVIASGKLTALMLPTP